MCDIPVLINLLTLFLVTSVSAKINITIEVKSNGDIVTNHSGVDYKLISAMEFKEFNVTDADINRGFRVELGKVPNNVFYKDPTPYGNLFHKYKWNEVKRSLKVKSVEVIDSLYEYNVTIDFHEHINNTTKIIKSKRIMFRTIENSVETRWFKIGLPKDNVVYDLDLNFGFGRFKYENQWKQNNLRAMNMQIGSYKAGDIEIKPGQSVITKLSATKRILLVEVTYEARLVGQLIGDYKELYGKYHFWAPSIQDIMKAAKMKNEIVNRERLEIKCFHSPRIDVYDKLTGLEVEPPKTKRKMVKILRNNNTSRVIHFIVKKKPEDDLKKNSENK